MYKPIFNESIELAENSMLKVRPDLFDEWDFGKNEGINIYKMTKGSSKEVYWTCKDCGSNYKNSVNNKVRFKCKFCVGNAINHTNCLATTNPELLNEWHPTLNTNITPFDVMRGSRDDVWWLCDKGHYWNVPVARRINSGCPYCSGRYTWIGFNDIWTTNPELASLLLNQYDGYAYQEGSNKHVDWKCSTCGDIFKNKTIKTVKNEGLKCPNCSDTKKYPERFMNFMLRQLGIEFKWDETTSWSNNKRYDFYLEYNDLNIIIETHGQQHYDGGFEFINGNDLDYEIQNDKYKYELAIKNGIDKYIVIDCRYSKFDYIKNSIVTSELAKLFDLTLVDWEDIHIKLNRTLIENIANDWNNGNTSSKEISAIYKITIKRTVSILEKATELGLCEYNKWIDDYYKRSIILKLDSKLNIVDKYLDREDALTENNLKTINTSSTTKSGGYYWCKEVDYIKFVGKIINNNKNKEIAKEERIKPIVQINLKGKVVKVWSKGKHEILEANKDYVESPLGNSLSRSQSTYKNYIWLYEEFYKTKEGKEYVKSIVGNNKIGSKKRSILQIDTVTGEVINKYESVVDVINVAGVNKSMIYKCLNREQLTTYGYIWMREREYETDEGKKYLDELLIRIKNFRNKQLVTN